MHGPITCPTRANGEGTGALESSCLIRYAVGVGTNHSLRMCICCLGKMWAADVGLVVGRTCLYRECRVLAVTVLGTRAKARMM